jgi:hypothetical protein
MTVNELIGRLQKMPADATVGYVWDGAARGEPEMVWLARGGSVLLGHKEDALYYDCDRPIDAPTAAENKYWEAGDEL